MSRHRSVALAGLSQALVTRGLAKLVMAAGMAMIGGGILCSTQVPVHGHFWASLAGPFIVVGAGTAFAFIPVSIAQPSRPVDRDHHRQLRSARARQAPGRRPAPALGAAPRPGQTYPRPGAPRFSAALRAAAPGSQPQKIQCRRPRTAQGQHNRPSPAPPRDQEGRVVAALPGLKRKLRSAVDWCRRCGERGRTAVSVGEDGQLVDQDH